MRPVCRGTPPAKSFARYQDATQPLTGRLGLYCSYCERQIETHLAVEHISPKSTDPAQETAWNNFLLACVNCNSSKGKTPINTAHYLWPDTDNTFYALDYQAACVIPSTRINSEQSAKAEALIKLVGLDKVPGNSDVDRRPTDNDRRWRFRNEVWDIAQHALNRLSSKDSLELREQVVDTAVGRGGFSIWLTIFKHDEDMCQRFINAFPGTSKYYFNKHAPPEAPAHVLKVIHALSEESIILEKKYIMHVTMPKPGDYRRISLELLPPHGNTPRPREVDRLRDRSVHVSMNEYSYKSIDGTNRVTVVIFDSRESDAPSVTQTRHYFEPLYDGQNITAITHLSLAFVAENIVDFLMHGKRPI